MSPATHAEIRRMIRLAIARNQNPWQIQRQKSGWNGGYVEWTEGRTAYISVVFSWLVGQAYQRACWLRAEGFSVRAGGPAISLQPDALADVAEIGGELDVLPRHNARAVFTSRGCVHRCAFCCVPKIEGPLMELNDWEPKPIICDNNLLATSMRHFDLVVDRLRGVAGVDFNQGLDARLLTKYHAERLRELDLRALRLAWDDTRLEQQFMATFQVLRSAGFPRRLIHVYVLIGFNDTPEDALYRLQRVRELGATPNPMRYQPLDAQRRNAFVAPEWTARELTRYMRYWQNIAHVGSVPFKEFRG